MKRFYCTVCNKVKRVQRWPDNVQAYTSVNVFDRIGECNWHNGGPRIIRTTGQSYKRVKPVKVVQVSKRRKAS
jgi:hypothetical protein